MMHRSSEVGADRRYYGTRPNLRQSRTMTSLLLTSLLFIPAASPAQMAGVVRGVDGKPIAGATVAVLGSTQTETVIVPFFSWRAEDEIFSLFDIQARPKRPRSS